MGNIIVGDIDSAKNTRTNIIATNISNNMAIIYSITSAKINSSTVIKGGGNAHF